MAVFRKASPVVGGGGAERGGGAGERTEEEGGGQRGRQMGGRRGRERDRWEEGGAGSGCRTQSLSGIHMCLTQLRLQYTQHPFICHSHLPSHFPSHLPLHLTSLPVNQHKKKASHTLRESSVGNGHTSTDEIELQLGQNV